MGGSWGRSTLRFDSSQLGSFSARRERHLGPGASRSVHHHYLIGLSRTLVVATGGAHLNGLADVAYITLCFPNNIIAHLNVNWLSP